jgi:hypothetical protein
MGVGIATRLLAGRPRGRGSIPGTGKRIFPLSVTSRSDLGPTQPPIRWVPGAVSSGVKRQGHEADDSLSSVAEVKNGGAVPSLSHTSSWRGA